MENNLFLPWIPSRIVISLNKLAEKFRGLLSPIIFLLSFFIATHAEAQTAKTVEAYFTEDDSENLKKLIYEHVPTLFIQNNEILFPDKGFPQKLICDANSIKMLEIENPGFRTIKLLQIEIKTTDQKSRINLSPAILKFFPNLSKILISSTVPLTSQEVSQMVNGYQEGDIVLLYQIQRDF